MVNSFLVFHDGVSGLFGGGALVPEPLPFTFLILLLLRTCDPWYELGMNG
jgi:hypothetical protein